MKTKTIDLIKAAAAAKIQSVYGFLEKSNPNTYICEIRGPWGSVVLHIEPNARNVSTKRWVAMVAAGTYANGRKIPTGPLVAV